MSSEHINVFTKENLDTFLKELGKEYRRLNSKSMPAEILLQFQEDYAGVTNTDNVDNILTQLKNENLSRKDSNAIWL